MLLTTRDGIRSLQKCLARVGDGSMGQRPESAGVGDTLAGDILMSGLGGPYLAGAAFARVATTTLNASHSMRGI